MRLSGVDVNLLVALGALLEERNVTHAGLRINMSQPAMSTALARLRTHFDDELLRRTGRTYELTDLGGELLPLVRRALDGVEAVLEPSTVFDPTQSTRLFTISLSDYAMTVLVEPLLALLSEQAPGVRVDMDPIPEQDIDPVTHLMRRDFLISALGYGFPGRRQSVFSDRFVCVVAADNDRLVEGRLGLDDIAVMPHAKASFGFGALTPADRALLEAGVEARVAVTVQGLLSLPFAVTGTDLCAFVPRRLALRCHTALELAIVDVFDEPVELVEAAHWHPSRSKDPSLLWFREVLGQLTEVLREESMEGTAASS
jgi:DNA-binding transcriptional LysR family regulator